MTDIGELVVRIRADAAQLERELAKANGIVKQSAGGMTSAFGRLKSELLSLAPAISAVGLVAFGKHALDAAGHIVDLADRIGFTADTLSALEIPLAASGASLDEFTGAVNRMNNVLGEAAKGSEEAVRAFDQLGLSVVKLRAMSPEEQFYEIATALGQIKDQSTQTEAGMNIFGRSFAVLLPLLKQYEGDMRKAVDAQKELNDGLSPETLKSLDDFGDKLAAQAIRVRNLFLEAAAAIIDTGAALSQATAKPSTNAKWNMPGQNPLPAAYIKKAKEMGMVTEATFVSQGNEQYGPAYQQPSAKGTNTALYGRIQAMKDAQKATKENTEATEHLADANDKLSESMQEAARFQQILHDRLSQSLTDIAFRAGSATDAMLGFAESIAKAAFEKRVAGPLADALIGTGGKSGLLDNLIPDFGGFFAEGGSPPVGVPSIVGERGPEMFIPNTRGTIVPNDKLGATTVVVQQTIQVNPGVPELINAKIREAAPIFAAQAQVAVFTAMQQGGPASKIIGQRN